MLVSWCEQRRKGKNAKEDNSSPSQFAEDEDVGILR